MESIRKVKDVYDFIYDVVSEYKNGYSILYQSHGATPVPWIIRTPDGHMIRFKREAELWEYALDKRLFVTTKGKEDG